jgi:hypothetical protein
MAPNPGCNNWFYLSGAFTVSAAVLQNSKFWYADEELSAEELAAAFDLYRKNKTRILLSHEGPSTVVAEILAGLDGSYVEASVSVRNPERPWLFNGWCRHPLPNNISSVTTNRR